ncbi:MAG TPA: hypothetical protein VD993_13600 [Chitinophagaceae bacterium]|nr:hypothetical protein [Chitinophagaceae bacterium]
MTFGDLTRAILFDKDNYKMLYEGVRMLHDFYAGITGITAVNNNDQNIYLPTGKAISPGQAANCLLDLRRTAVFLRGIYKAIIRLQQEFPGRQIEVLYAGCGPYASLLTPLTTMFVPQQVRFHMMDVQPESLVAVGKLYGHLNASEYLGSMTCADATTYQMTQDFDLVIVEAMQSALIREPQVAITLNLLPQMKEKAIFIPQEIRVTAQLLDREMEMNGYLAEAAAPVRIKLGDVYRIGQFNYDPPQPVLIDVPASVGTHNELHLLTELTVFEDEVLEVNNCGITLPYKVAAIEPYLGKQVRFEYEIGETPGFKWEFGMGVAATEKV